jgi:hypothetical protein
MAVSPQEETRDRQAEAGEQVSFGPRKAPGRRSRIWRRIGWFALAGAAFFLPIQAVPYGRSHGNPPTTAEPRWDSPLTRELAARACFDCHSNLTSWPWYSNIAPVSWLIQRDVDGGRGSLNFSEWNQTTGRRR